MTGMVGCGCWNGPCQLHGGYTSVTDNVTGNGTTTFRYSSRGALELELDRQIEEFARRAKIRIPRPITKVDEKKLITQPTRAHAKPHRASSSRAAMSVRQFAQRVK